MKYIFIIILILIFNSANASDLKDGRFFEDQPDTNDDYQIHFIYMLDINGKDNELDINGELEKIIEEMNQKMFELTGNKQKYKLDYRQDGKLDISFVRLDKSRRLNKSGVGLGLAIVEDIINSHGGNISLGKGKHNGLQVKISLPF